MAYQCLRDELRPRNVHVASVMPGIVDTPMQTLIRSCDKGKLPDVEYFRELKDGSAADADAAAAAAAHDGAAPTHAPPAEGLDSAQNCAAFLVWLLTSPDVDGEQFSAKEWDIRDPSHHARWAA